MIVNKYGIPTAEEILELFEEISHPSASKLRAGLLKKGFEAKLKAVGEFVKSEMPTQLCANAPKYRGKIIASRPNDRRVMGFVDLPMNPPENSNTSSWFKTSFRKLAGRCVQRQVK